RSVAQPVAVDIVGERAVDLGPTLHGYSSITLHVIYLARASRPVPPRSAIHTFVQDYIAVWNEPDAGRRRQLIRTLWQEDAHHLARTLEALGHARRQKRVSEGV